MLFFFILFPIIRKKDKGYEEDVDKEYDKYEGDKDEYDEECDDEEYEEMRMRTRNTKIGISRSPSTGAPFAKLIFAKPSRELA